MPAVLPFTDDQIDATSDAIQRGFCSLLWRMGDEQPLPAAEDFERVARASLGALTNTLHLQWRDNVMMRAATDWHDSRPSARMAA